MAEASTEEKAQRTPAAEKLAETILAEPDLGAQLALAESRLSEIDDEVAEAIRQGALQFLRSDLDRTFQVSALLYQLSDLANNPKFKALGLWLEAHARSIGLGEYDQSLKLYDQSSELFERSDEPLLSARAQGSKLWSLASLGRSDEAIEIGKAVAQQLKQEKLWLSLGILMMNMGVIHSRSGEDSAALTAFNSARGMFLSEGERGLGNLALVELDRGIVLRNLGKFGESIEAIKTAQQIMTDLNQSVEAARARQNLGITFYMHGRFNEALQYLDEAREVFQQDNRVRDAALIDLFASDCLLQLRRFEEVLKKCSRVRESFSDIGGEFEVAQSLLNAGMAYAGLGRVHKAEESFSAAVHLFESTGNPIWRASAQLELAGIAIELDDDEIALQIAEEASTVFANQAQKIRMVQAFLISARAARRLNRITESAHHAANALDLARSLDLPHMAHIAHSELGKLAEVNADISAARERYQSSMLELERSMGRIMVEHRIGFLEDKQSIYEDLVRIYLDGGETQKAFETVERSKSRVLVDMLAYRPEIGIHARSKSDIHLINPILQLKAERDRLYRHWQSPEVEAGDEGTTKNADAAQLSGRILQLEREITKHWHRLLVKNADYAKDASIWQVRADPVQPYLKEDEILVEYFTLSGKLLVFLVTHDSVEHVQLETDEREVHVLNRLLRLNIQSVPRSDVDVIPELCENAQDLLNRLFLMLFAPIEEIVAQYAALIFVPHGSLHYVPFHALFDGTRHLIECYETSYLPSASVLRYCTSESGLDKSGVAIGHSHRGELPHCIEEAREIAGVMSFNLMLEEEATLAAVKEQLETQSVCHLATHGEFRLDQALFSGVAMHDGWLSSLDVFGIRSKAALVALSACETGQSWVSGGDELQGLMRAFLYSGVCSLILSYWSVEDQSSSWWMSKFYRNLASGQTCRHAMQSTQIAFIEGAIDSTHRNVYKHPFYWAQFFLVGDGSTRVG